MRLMKSFLAAVRFLTVFPTGNNAAVLSESRLGRDESKDDKRTMASSLIFFPAVGAAVGALSAGAYCLTALFSNGSFLPAVISVTTLLAISGFLHLDGLADTFDAFLNRKSRDETLAIMRDPHVGTFGIAGIVCTLLLKIALIASVREQAVLVGLTAAGLLSRYAMVFMMYVFPYAREEGKAKVFMEGITPSVFWTATGITFLGAVVLLNLQGCLVMAGAMGVAYMAGRWSRLRIGGITGDVLGAANELTEIFILISMVLLQGGKV